MSSRAERFRGANTIVLVEAGYCSLFLVQAWNPPSHR